MSSELTNEHGAVCPACKKLLDPLDKNHWIDYFKMILCQYCVTRITYHLCNFEKPKDEMIELVEELSGKPYWQYQLYTIGQDEQHDENTIKVLRHATAMKKRSEFKLVRS